MRKILSLLALLVLLLSLVLLLNFTHPNPTHRRYSSASPFVTGQANSTAIGLTAELILGADLRLIRNDESSERRCICNSNATSLPSRGECNVCMLSAPISGTHRRPDFITTSFIAESKNRQNLLYGMDSTVDEQLTDYAAAARAAGIPLWIYVRVNTTISQDIITLARSTGGDVIPYFTVDGYIDPVDRAAQVGLITSGALLSVLIISAPRKARVRPIKTKSTSKPIDTAEAFSEKQRDKYQSKINKEDARHDL